MAALHLDEIPHRIFLDSSALQALQTYGGYLHENEPLAEADRIHNDPNGVTKLEALRKIMLIAERAPFAFALSENSFAEVRERGDPDYLRWAQDVLDHWLACLSESDDFGAALTTDHIDSTSYGYLGAGDRALIKDALSLKCDTFLTMENKLPKNAAHLQDTLGIRVVSPVEMWEMLRPWAGLFK